MSAEETQLRPAEESLDNQDRNKVVPQTQEPYGDAELAVETQVISYRHFAGQPLETKADHDANEAVRAEQYAAACLDPAYAAKLKIDVKDEDKGEAWLAPTVPLVSPVPDEVHGE